MVDRDSDQPGRPGCSLVEALGTVVTVEAEIRTDSELESSHFCFSRIVVEQCMISLWNSG